MVINRVSMVVCLSSVLSIFAGCSHRFETGYSDFNRVQVQFYAPTGATVTVAQNNFGFLTPDRSHQINHYPTESSRLERRPEETSTFNLCPGDYEFKYTGATGLEGANIYGNLIVYSVNDCALPGSREMIRRVFIPIALPSPLTSKSLTPKDDIFPYQSSAHRLRITYNDIERLTAGDLVTKVVFIADLKKLEAEHRNLEVEYTCLKGKQQRLSGLLNEAKLDWLENPKDKKFIELQCDLKKIEQSIDRNRDRAARIEALLRADNVLIRRNMMVIATDEILPVHEDPVAAAGKLGQVVMVMHLGGRHLQWGNAAQEATAFNK